MSLQVNRIAAGVLLLVAMVGAPSLATAATTSGQSQGGSETERVIVVARSDAEYDALRSEVERAGGSIAKDIRSGGMLVATGTPGLQSRIEATGRAKAVAKDHIETLIRPSAQADLLNSSTVRSRTTIDAATSNRIGEGAAAKKTVTGDPAFSYPGLMWSLLRIHAAEAWQTTLGSPAVHVGVADTGLDFTHSELQRQVSSVVDFTVSENPPICSTFFLNPFTGASPGLGDADLAKMFGGPEKTDWNGHGSWIGGNIAGALDGQGVNGAAPKVKLVSLKISQWCGAAYDSTILDAFTYAADHHIDVVSISFGGYLDLRDPSQAIIWGQYIQTVQRAADLGTVIVAAAGNDHVQIGAAGLVTSHGPLTTPGTTPADFVAGDLFGQFEVPGGVPGVVDVSSTGNVNVPSSASCAPGTAGSKTSANAVCKPKSDAHQAGGQSKENQLAYYSNYGSRIDVAGPGGARKFNLPTWDRGGTPGFPYTTADLTTAFEDFSITSNWALQIPCFVFSGGGFPADQCYSTIQGTSMATPHASGVLALIASHEPDVRHHTNELVQILKQSATHVTGNATQVLSATDLSASDRTGVACPSGYCHLGGAAVSDREAYGAGLVDAQRAVLSVGQNGGDQNGQN